MTFVVGAPLNYSKQTITGQQIRLTLRRAASEQGHYVRMAAQILHYPQLPQQVLKHRQYNDVRMTSGDCPDPALSAAPAAGPETQTIQ